VSVRPTAAKEVGVQFVRWLRPRVPVTVGIREQWLAVQQPVCSVAWSVSLHARDVAAEPRHDQSEVQRLRSEVVGVGLLIVEVGVGGGSIEEPVRMVWHFDEQYPVLGESFADPLQLLDGVCEVLQNVKQRYHVEGPLPRRFEDRVGPLVDVESEFLSNGLETLSVDLAADGVVDVGIDLGKEMPHPGAEVQRSFAPVEFPPAAVSGIAGASRRLS